MDAAKSAELNRMVRQEVGGEFEIERELGRGGMAVVYLATETHLGRKVAIKVLPPDLTFGAGAIDRFKREARTAATLDHPNIIPIYRVSPGGRLFWYAMKYLEGQSLADLLKQESRLSLERTIAILEQVASALDYAHRRNVIHRDIKPANIMLDDDDRVVITDFGIAKQLSTGGLTASGSAIGTPYYMSPEQCTAVKVLSGAADQYSVGVMTYQMLSGALPFEGDSVIEILQKHCTAAPPPLDVLRPGLPRHVYGAIDKALSKKAEDRFATVKAFVAALKQPSPDLPTTPTRRPTGWKKISATTVAVATSRKTWLTVLGLAVVGGAGIGGLALRRMNRARSLSVSAMTRSDSVARQQGRPVDSTPGIQVGTRQADSAPPVTTRPLETLPTASQPGGGPASGRTATATPLRPEPRPNQPTRAAPSQTTAPPVAPPEPGVLVVRTTGGWARIYVDNVLRREGTSHRDTLPAGEHQIRLEREGFLTIDTTVTVGAGALELVTLTMRPREP
jgi:serine/threonine protein kinase